MPPLPKPPDRRRRHAAPTIPTTYLPASGRHTPAPRLPRWMKLGPTGRAWWRWAWKLPQACGWDVGAVPVVARRAQMEDLWAAEPSVSWSREMRELEDRLGLTPKGRALLRWEIVDDQYQPGPGGEPAPLPAGGAESDEVTRRRVERERRLTAGEQPEAEGR